MAKQRNLCFLLLLVWVLQFVSARVFVDGSGGEYVSGVGDPGMRRDGLRLAIESWNQCNEVGDEAPHMGSPRAADCFDIHNASLKSHGNLFNLKFLLSILPQHHNVQIMV